MIKDFLCKSVVYSGQLEKMTTIANHLYDMEAADDVGNDMGSQIFKEFIF